VRLFFACSCATCDKDVLNSLTMSGSLRIAVLILCLFIGFETEAKAYTDPGTGALIWQMVAAGFVGAMFYFRRLRVFVSGFLKKNDDKE